MNRDLDKDIPEKVKTVLDSEQGSLSEYDLLRLSAARMSALDKLPSAPAKAKISFLPWVAGVSVASVAMVAVLFVRSQGEFETGEQYEIAYSVDDVEWVLSAEDLALMSEDLEFYEWIDSELEADTGSET